MNSDPQLITNLWLIRHGEPANESGGRCYGSLDVPLSPAGVCQAKAVAQSVPSRMLCAIYSSPRTRCLHTAQLIAAHQGCPVIAIDEFSELNFGHFEGKSYDEIAATDPEIYAMWMEQPTKVRFPGGEAFQEMRERVLSAADRVRQCHAGSSFAVVAHGGANRIILADALGLPCENIFRIGQRYASISLIRYYDEHPVIELMNGSTLI
jgi:alpha-ribazole phosphatase